MVSFIGSCDVPVDRMADLEDVRENAPIVSKRMLHFIVEHFQCELETAVLRQRLLICLLSELINSQLKGERIRRLGDDLYLGEAKLSVSIAVKSPVSCMIHAGLNVESRGVPVRAVGLRDLGVDPQPLAESAIHRYGEELRRIRAALCKVRGVS